MKNYLLYYFSFFAIGLLLSMAPIFYLYSIGEYEKIEDVVSSQLLSERPVIYGSGLYGDTFFYKANLVRAKESEILILGSSRVMQFRQHMFLVDMVNAGGVMNSINEGQRFYDEVLREIPQPELIIIGIDYWWFNKDYDNPLRQSNLSQSPRVPSIQHVIKVANWLNDGKISHIDIIDSFINQKSGIGVSGVGDTGFGADGSYYYTSSLSKHNPYTGFEPTVRIVEDGHGRLKYGDMFDPNHFKNFFNLLQDLRSLGSDVAVFFPPFPDRVYSLLERNQNHAYMNELRTAFIEAEISFMDFSDISSFGGNDCEFIDGVHGGEIAYIRILLEMAKSTSDVSRYIDEESLKNKTIENSGSVYFQSLKGPKVDEVDFLNIDCVKNN